MRALAVACCLLLAACSGSTSPAETQETTVTFSPTADEGIGFAPVPDIRIETIEHLDGEVEALIDTLQTLVDPRTAPKPDSLEGMQKAPTDWQKDASIHFWRFQNRLERRVLSSDQEAMVAAAMDALAVAHPEARDYIEHRRWMAQHLGIGKVAPEIVGKDLDQVEFKLSETRGKVTVLVFTGEWCGPCRSEYPYQRLMLELYKDKPFALVGVNSDADLEVAKKGKVDSQLPYRSWWDGYAEKNTEGPIAKAWGVTGWPTIYVLDTKGVIRFAGLRHEDTLKAVAQLMSEADED